MSRAASIFSHSVFALLLGGAVLGAQADLFTPFGANEVEGRNQVFSAFSSGRVYPVGTADVFKAAADAGRVAMVQGVVAFARTYAGSADFARRYTEFRDARKPSPPGPAQTNDSMVAQQRKALEEGIANAQNMAESMPQMKADIDKMVTEFKQQLAQLGQDKAMNAQMDEMFKMQAANEAAEHQKALAKWERDFPADAKGLVAARLKSFLDVSATVDFTATTEFNPKSKRYMFVNKALELKDNQWKMLYRAGKPAVDAARAAAQEWLKTLG